MRRLKRRFPKSIEFGDVVVIVSSIAVSFVIVSIFSLFQESTIDIQRSFSGRQDILIRRAKEMFDNMDGAQKEQMKASTKDRYQNMSDDDKRKAESVNGKY